MKGGQQIDISSMVLLPVGRVDRVSYECFWARGSLQSCDPQCVPLSFSLINCFVFPDDSLNFGIKTLEEIKLKKQKEKTKKQSGELICPTLLSVHIFCLFSSPPFFFPSDNTQIAGDVVRNRAIHRSEPFSCTAGFGIAVAGGWELHER